MALPLGILIHPMVDRQEPSLPDLESELASDRVRLFVNELVGGALLLPALLVAYALLTVTGSAVVMIVVSSAVAALTQAWLMSGWRQRGLNKDLQGGLIAPAICTLGHLLALGSGIVEAPQIILVWVAALLV